MKRYILSTLLSVIFVTLLSACSIPPANNFKDSNRVPDTAQDASPNAEAAMITKEDALQAALTHAGLVKDDVSYVHVESDFDDRIKHYEVEFYHNSIEYNYEIDAQTKDVISFEKDID